MKYFTSVAVYDCWSIAKPLSCPLDAEIQTLEVNGSHHVYVFVYLSVFLSAILLYIYRIVCSATIITQINKLVIKKTA